MFEKENTFTLLFRIKYIMNWKLCWDFSSRWSKRTILLQKNLTWMLKIRESEHSNETHT